VKLLPEIPHRERKGELSADSRVRDERISEPQETRQRRGRRPIRELILRELSFSGQAMAAAQIAKAINYIPERTETALGRMEKDIDWKAEGIRSSALEFVAYSLGFFHDGHRAASDCRATLHALAQPLPGTGRLALQALLEQARLPTWRRWARDAAIEKKDVLKARAYSWSPGEVGRPKCWYRDVSDAEKTTEVSWLRANVMGPGQAIWALRITAKDRYSDRCWGWGKPLDMALKCAADGLEGEGAL
jgi:hypothetical protein